MNESPIYWVLVTQFLPGIYLGRQAITVFIEYKIHTAFGKLRFFEVAAANLFFLSVGGANRHLLLLTEIDFQM